MASQEKHYIELGDILSLRFDCKHEQCGASLSLPFTVNVAKSLSVCPKCGRKWAGELNGAHARAIGEFERALFDLKGQAAAPDFNVNLCLEIASAPGSQP